MGSGSNPLEAQPQNDNTNAGTSDLQSGATSSLYSDAYGLVNPQSQQRFSTFLNATEQNILSNPNQDDNSLLLNSAQVALDNGTSTQDLSVLQGYIAQPAVTTDGSAPATTQPTDTSGQYTLQPGEVQP